MFAPLGFQLPVALILCLIAFALTITSLMHKVSLYLRQRSLPSYNSSILRLGASDPCHLTMGYPSPGSTVFFFKVLKTALTACCIWRHLVLSQVTDVVNPVLGSDKESQPPRKLSFRAFLQTSCLAVHDRPRPLLSTVGMLTSSSKDQVLSWVQPT